MKRKKTNMFIIMFLAVVMSLGTPMIVSAHTYTQETRIDPTCKESGKIIHQCIYCDFYYEGILPALGHDYQIINETEATCEEEGSIIYTCSRCEVNYEKKTQALGHDYQMTDSRKASCKEKGYETYTCGHCQDGYKKEIPALGHDYQMTNSQKASCEEKGFKIFTCTRCQDSYKKEILALGHDYQMTGSRKTSCEENGFETFTCNHCKNSYTKELSALGHDYRLADSKVSTTTEAGYRTYTCNRCQKSHTDSIPMIEIEQPSQLKPAYDKNSQSTKPTQEEIQLLQPRMETSSKKISHAVEKTKKPTDIIEVTEATEEKQREEIVVSPQITDKQKAQVVSSSVSAIGNNVGADHNQMNLLTGFLATLIFAVYGSGGIYIFSFRSLLSWIKKGKKLSFAKLYGGDR